MSLSLQRAFCVFIVALSFTFISGVSLAVPNNQLSLSELQAKLNDTASAGNKQLQSQKDEIKRKRKELIEAREDRDYWIKRQKELTANNSTFDNALDAISQAASVTERGATLSVVEAKLVAATKTVRTLSAQIASLQDGIRRTNNIFQSRISNLKNLIVVKNPDTRADEENRRLEEMARLSKAYYTQVAQIEITKAKFAGELHFLNNVKFKLIEEDKIDVAQYLHDNDIAELKKTRDDFLVSMRRVLFGKMEDLIAAYDRNIEDGLGPTTSDELDAALIAKAKAEGKDPREAIDNIDEEAIQLSGASTLRVAEGLANNVKHNSVFDEVTATAVVELIEGVGDTTVRYARNPSELGENLKAYYDGVEDAALEGAKDLIILGNDALIAGAQLQEQAFNYYFTADSNVFGTDKVEALDSIATQLVIYYDGGEGREGIKKSLRDKAYQFVDFVDRRVSKQAVNGDVKGFLKDTGKVVGTIAGAEEIGFLVIYKTLSKGSKIIKFANSVEDAVTASNKVSNALIVTEKTTKVVDLTTDTGRLIDNGPFNGSVNRPVDGPGISDDLAAGSKSLGESPPDLTATFNEDLTKTVRLDAQGNKVSADLPEAGKATVNAGGTNGEDLVVQLPDGQNFLVRQSDKIGEGAGTAAFDYRDPTTNLVDNQYVVKVTRGGAFAKIDDVGDGFIKAIEDGKNVLTPEIKVSYEISSGTRLGKKGEFISLDGGKVQIVDKVQDYSSAKGPDALLGPQETEAVINFLNHANDNGIVVLDLKADNFAFLPNPKSDGLITVPIDNGGTIAIKGRNAEKARELQEAVLDLGFAPGADNGSFGYFGKLYDRFDDIALKFDADVDFDIFNDALKGTGKEVNTLGLDLDGSLKFNPSLGVNDAGFANAFKDARKAVPAVDLPSAGPIASASTPPPVGNKLKNLKDAVDTVGGELGDIAKTPFARGFVARRGGTIIAGANNADGSEKRITFTLDRVIPVQGFDVFNAQQIRQEFSDDGPLGGVPAKPIAMIAPGLDDNADDGSNDDTSEGDTSEGDTSEGDTSEGDTPEGDTSDSNVLNFLSQCIGDSVTVSNINAGINMFAEDSPAGCEFLVNQGGGESEKPLVLSVFSNGGFRGNHNIAISGGDSFFNVSPSVPVLSAGFGSLQQTFTITMDFVKVPSAQATITLGLTLIEGTSNDNQLTVTIINAEVN